MLKVVYFCVLLVVISGHSNSPKNEADLQTALMPQELNPEFVSDQDTPWRAVLPIPRPRRNVELLDSSPSVTSYVKRYSRAIACLTLVTSALVEIVLYLIDFYNTI